jgi:hypothetical protein
MDFLLQLAIVLVCRPSGRSGGGARSRITPHEEIALPSRVFDPDYERHTLSAELFVPQKY